MLRGGGGKPFDIAQSLEVAEHLYEQYASNFIQLLTSLSDIVLFSAAIPYQGGTHHVNEQPPGYWVKLFAERDYQCFDILRLKLWQNQDIEAWYRQNIFLYVHKNCVDFFTQQGFVATQNPLYLVCPDIYESKAKYIQNLEKNNQSLNMKLNKTFSRRLQKIIDRIRGK